MERRRFDTHVKKIIAAFMTEARYIAPIKNKVGDIVSRQIYMLHTQTDILCSAYQ